MNLPTRSPSVSLTMSTRKLTSTRLEDKVKIVNALDHELKINKKGAVNRVATKFNVPHYTVSRFYNDKEKIIAAFSTGLKSDSSRVKNANSQNLKTKLSNGSRNAMQKVSI